MSEQLPAVPSPSGFEPSVRAVSGSKPEAVPPRPYRSGANGEETGTPASPVPGSPGRTDPTNWVQRWDNDEFEINRGSLLGVGGALLKNQGQLARDLLHGHGATRYLLGCALLVALSTIVYGAIVGSFTGAEQACLAALKCPLVVLGSSAICLPSFYVFQCLMGARLSLIQAAQSVLFLCAASALILLACAPIVWFFSMSTQIGSPAFLMALHLTVIALATYFGARLLFRMHRYIVQRHRGERLFDGRVLTAWLIMYLLVAAQLACFLGPLMSDGAFFTGERSFFVSTFLHTLKQ